MKLLSFLFVLAITIGASAGGISRSRAKVVNYNNVDRVVIEQKVIEYSDQGVLQIIAVPVTDLGAQYYYQSEPLRGRGQGLSDTDRKLIVEEIVAGVLAGIDSRFEILPPDNGTPVEKPNTGGGVVPPKPSSTPNVSDLDKQVLNIFTNSCSTCHTAGALHAEGIPTLLTADGQLNKLEDVKSEKLKRYAVWDATYYGKMPSNNSPLPESDVDVLHRWIQEVK